MIFGAFGLAIALILGLLVANAPFGKKWLWLEVVLASAAALAAVVAALLWKEHSQHPCHEPTALYPRGWYDVCAEYYSFKHVVMGYGAYLVGLGAGLIYRLAVEGREGRGRK